MAAYQTQQINVGSIAAPDVGSVFANFADRLQKQQSNQIDMARQMRQDDRQQVLNQRADQDWNRQQGIYKAKADVAADFATNQFADKYTGQNKVNNDAVVNAYVKYVENGGEMTDDLNKRVQALTEQNRGFQEDAIPAIAQELVKRSNGAISMTDAMNEAKGIAMGLPSRVAQQELADKETKRQQEYQDLIAKNNLDKFKMQAEIAKDNQEGRYKDAELKFKQFQAMYGGGTGGSGGSGSSGSTGFSGGYTGLSNLLGTIGWYDAKDATAVDSNAKGNAIGDGDGWYTRAHKLGYTDAQINTAAGKSVDSDPSAWLFHDKTINQEALKQNLAQMVPGASATNITPTFKEIQAPTDEQWQSTVPKYVDRTIIGATPNTAEARARLVVPELFRGDPNKIVEETKVSNPDVAKSIDMFTQQTKKVESSNNYNSVNKESGAMGAYQFLPSTLNDYRGKHGLPNFTNEEFLNNKDLQDKVFNEFTKDNAHKLEVLGIEPTPLNLYAAHNLGIGNVKELNSNSENLSNRLQKALAANHLDSKEDWFNRNSSKFEIKPTTSKYSGLKLPEATKQVYKDIVELYAKNTPEVYQGQTALNASRGDMSEEAYKKYLDWAAKEDPGIRPILEGYTGTTTEDKAKTFLRQQDIAFKYINNPSKLTAAESRWIKESRQTPNGRKLLASLGIE